MTKAQYWADKEERAKAKAVQVAHRVGNKAMLLYANAVREQKADARQKRARLRRTAPLAAVGVQYRGNVTV